MAKVMVLQRFEGLSDSEAVDRLQFDLRYKWACGLPFDSFDSTLLVDMRARLRERCEELVQGDGHGSSCPLN